MRKDRASEISLIKRADQFIDEILPELVRFRRDLHRHPEVAWEERRTTEQIIRFLESNKFAKISCPLATGLFCDFDGGAHQPLLAIRADIDALAIPDAKQVEYRSQNPGKSHACGHDVHTAVVCGVAKTVQQFSRYMPVNVRFVFQPAEEPIPSGAPKMIEAGVLNGVQAMFGMHVESRLPLGTIALTEGWVNAQSIRLDWEILGKGGHSARPEEAIDPITAGVELIHRARVLSAERWQQTNFPVILQFTRFRSGEAYNAIPETANLTATLRLTRAGLHENLLSELEELNRQVANRTGVNIKMTKKIGAPPVFNDSGLIRKMQQIWKDTQIPGTKVDKEYRSMGGDDFSWYGQQVPVSMVRFGTKQAKRQYQAHSSLFDVPEEVIGLAVKFFIRHILLWRTAEKRTGRKDEVD